jgi:ABC-type maltose transport system permease subunit
VTAFLWGVAATLAVVVLAAVCTDADARHDWLAALAGLLAVPVVILYMRTVHGTTVFEERQKQLEAPR